MTKLGDYHLRAAGIWWCQEEDYPALLAIFEDADQLPRRWEDWLKFSEEAENAHKANGLIVERAYIDAGIISEWCRLHNRRINSEARQAFAAAVAAEKHGRNQS